MRRRGGVILDECKEHHILQDEFQVVQNSPQFNSEEINTIEGHGKRSRSEDPDPKSQDESSVCARLISPTVQGCEA
jgi:hypothetical protein